MLRWLLQQKQNRKLDVQITSAKYEMDHLQLQKLIFKRQKINMALDPNHQEKKKQLLPLNPSGTKKPLTKTILMESFSRQIQNLQLRYSCHSLQPYGKYR